MKKLKFVGAIGIAITITSLLAMFITCDPLCLTGIAAGGITAGICSGLIQKMRNKP